MNHPLMLGVTLSQILALNISELIAVGCDGTAVYTGKTNGVIACLEKKLKSELQHLVCIFHTNELLLRHLINKLDEVSTGPKTFSGLIGAKLLGCEKPACDII